MSATQTFVDLQVNGYGGVDFNHDDLSGEDFRRACLMLRQHGVERVLATIITDDLNVMLRRIRAIASLRREDPTIAQVVSGIHVEGPFISAKPGYVGAHPPEFACRASLDVAAKIVDAGDGLVRLFTLAPECDAQGAVTNWLARQGVVVSAGHTDASVDELQQAIDAGLSMFTHLGNGCPLVMHRHDNIVQRVLSLASQLWISFIADGVHIPWLALKNYFSLVGIENAIVVTDATAASGCEPGKYRLSGQEVVVDEQGATWSVDCSHLMGSASTMPQLADNLKRHLQLTDDDVRRVVYVNPLTAILQKLPL